MENPDDGKPSDEELDTVDDIESNFDTLIIEVKGLRKDLIQVKRSKVRDRVVGGLFALFALGFIFTNYNNNHKNKSTLNAVKAQGIAGVVSNCAFTNLQSINVTELITDFERAKIISSDIAVTERARFQRVNCVGLVSESGEELNICLQYPNVTDPVTGQPIPTTTTPSDKKACDEADENQRKAAEEQEKKLKEQRGEK